MKLAQQQQQFSEVYSYIFIPTYLKQTDKQTTICLYKIFVITFLFLNALRLKRKVHQCDGHNKQVILFTERKVSSFETQASVCYFVCCCDYLYNVERRNEDRKNF